MSIYFGIPYQGTAEDFQNSDIREHSDWSESYLDSDGKSQNRLVNTAGGMLSSADLRVQRDERGIPYDPYQIDVFGVARDRSGQIV